MNMKLRFLKDYRSAKKGQIVEVAENNAKRLIDKNIAVEVKEEKREKQTKEVKFVSVKEHKNILERVEKLEKVSEELEFVSPKEHEDLKKNIEKNSDKLEKRVAKLEKK